MRPQIDTRRIVEGLRDHFTPEQVEALTIVIVETLPEIVATKGDVDLLRAEIVTTRGDLTLMRATRARAWKKLSLLQRLLAAVAATPLLFISAVLANAVVTVLAALAVAKLFVH